MGWKYSECRWFTVRCHFITSWPHTKSLVSLPSLPEFHFIRRQPHSFYNVWPSLLGSTEVPKGRRKWPIWSPLMCIRSPSIQLCRLGNLLPPPRWWPCRGPAGKTGGETGSPVGSRCLRCTDGWLDNLSKVKMCGNKRLRSERRAS